MLNVSVSRTQPRLSNLTIGANKRCHGIIRCSIRDQEKQTSKKSAGILSVLGLGALKAKATLTSMALRACQDTDADAINAQIKENVKSLRMLALVMPFAAVSGSTDTFFIITKAVASFIKVRLTGSLLLMMIS